LNFKVTHMALTPVQKKNNLRMALILASIAAVFFVGFMVKMVLLTSR
jgi:hypothetical protein